MSDNIIRDWKDLYEFITGERLNGLKRETVAMLIDQQLSGHFDGVGFRFDGENAFVVFEQQPARCDPATPCESVVVMPVHSQDVNISNMVSDVIDCILRRQGEGW